MAVDDLWISKRTKQRTDRYGKGLRYRVRVPGHPAKSFRTRDAALLAEARMRSEKPRTHVDLTVGEALDVWLTGKRGLRPRGYEAAANAAQHVRARWALERAQDVRPYEVQAWIAGHPLGAASKHKILQALAGALRVAVQSGAIDSNPCDGVTIAKGRTRDAHFLDVAQVAKVAGECGAYAPMVWLLATCGPRIGECVALNVGDVNRRTRRLRVRESKNGEPRDVPIPAKVLAMLDLDRDRDEPLFVSSAGYRLDRNRWSARVWRPARERAGFPDLHVHDLRHTAASIMIDAGATPKDVQAALGHKSAAMTLDLYAGHFNRRLDDVAQRVNALL